MNSAVKKKFVTTIIVERGMTYVEQINLTRVPKHIAIIMDGNGRWAKERGLERSEGHRKGLDVVHEITDAAAEVGVQYLTLYAFSTENWNRPQAEVDALMALVVFWHRAGNSRNGREGSPFVGYRRFGPLAI